MDDEISKHIQPVFRFAMRLTKSDRHRAEDLTQETLLRAMRARSQLSSPQHARAWLFQIASNLWRDQHRRRKGTTELTGSPLPEQTPAIKAEVGQAVMLQEQCARAIEQLDTLPDRQRQVLYLSACEELSIAEIASVLGITQSAVKASLCVARARMRYIQDTYEADPIGGKAAKHDPT